MPNYGIFRNKFQVGNYESVPISAVPSGGKRLSGRIDTVDSVGGSYLSGFKYLTIT